MGLGLGIGIDSVSGGGIPFKSDLQTWHKGLTNDTFNESLAPFNAKIIPSCFKGNNSGYYTLPASAFVFNDNNFEIEFDFYTTSLAAANFVLGSAVDGNFRWYIQIATTGAAVLLTEYNNVTRQVISKTGLIEINKYYTISFRINRGGTNYVYINGVQVETPVTNQDILNFDNAGTKQIMTLATNYNSVYKTSYVKTIINSTLAEYYILPSGYDVSGNNRHATKVNVVAANVGYMVDATTHLNDYGYSLWEHATSADIQVPYNLASVPLSLTAGVNIPAGYSKTLDIPHIADKWNMADCLIGFNETLDADAKLEIFDRSNTTRQSPISRASSYYDNTSLATKSRYHITEITDPRIYFEYFNVGYAGKLFGKVELELIGETYYFKYYVEQYNYATDKTGANQFKVMEYCNIDVFAE